MLNSPWIQGCSQQPVLRENDINVDSTTSVGYVSKT